MIATDKESDDDRNNGTRQYVATLFEGADEVVPFSLRGRGTRQLSRRVEMMKKSKEEVEFESQG